MKKEKFTFEEAYGNNHVRVTIERDSGFYEVHLYYVTKRGRQYWLDRSDYVENNQEVTDLLFTREKNGKFYSVEDISGIRHWRIPMKALQVFNRMCEIYLD